MYHPDHPDTQLMQDMEFLEKAGSPPDQTAGSPPNQGTLQEIQEIQETLQTPQRGNDPTTPQPPRAHPVVLLPKGAKRNSPFDLDTSPERLAPKRTPNLLFQRSIASDKIQKARQLLIEAAASLEDQGEEQTKVLDLLQVFREYTESKTVTASKIIAKQITHLEATSRKLAHQASKPTYAQAAAPASKEPRVKVPEWSTVTRKKTPVTTQSQNPEICRLVLVLQDKEQEIRPLIIRDKINALLRTKGYTGQPCLLARKSQKSKNLVIELTSSKARESVLTCLPNLETFFKVQRVIDIEDGYKAVLRGVNLTDFNVPDGLTRIKSEIELYNYGVKIRGTPIWLTPEEHREKNPTGLVLVYFDTEDALEKALKNRLYLGGSIVYVEKGRDRKEKRTPNLS
jgi:hypothetical protein